LSHVTVVTLRRGFGLDLLTPYTLNYTEVYVNKAWETLRENIKISAKESIGYYEPQKNKSCSKLLDQKIQAKLQRLHHPKRNKWG
jgi:hypothetical protein